MKTRKLVVMVMLSMLLLSNTVMGMNITKKIHIHIGPRHPDRFKKIYNIVNESNVQKIGVQQMWNGFQTDGRIVDEGILPTPYLVKENTTNPEISIYMARYLKTYDILQGESDVLIRLPIAINATIFSSNNTIVTIRMYDVNSQSYNVSYYDLHTIHIKSYGEVHEIYNATNYSVAYLESYYGRPDLLNQTYNYPPYVSNARVEILYLHYRGPLIPSHTYVLFESVSFKSTVSTSIPFYILCGYKNQTSSYFNGTNTVKIPTPPQWGMLARMGMSEQVYSVPLVDPNTHYYIYKNLGYQMFGAGQQYNFSFVIPVYAPHSTNFSISITLHYYNGTNGWIFLSKQYVLAKGMNTLFLNKSGTLPAGNTVYFTRMDVEMWAQNFVYVYGEFDYSQQILSKVQSYPNSVPVPPLVPYFLNTQILFFTQLSENSSIQINTFNFTGVSEPIILYHTKYVFDLLDIPIGIYKGAMFIVTNFIYLATFGQVDLRYLYSDQFILNVVRDFKYYLDTFVDWLEKSPIGLAIDMVVNFIVNSAAWWGNWLLQFGLFILNIAAYAIFLWPWIVLSRGLIALQEQGVDAMLDYYASYVDRVTSVMSKLLVKKGVG